MKITTELLEQHGACQTGLDAFSELYPEGVEWLFHDAAFAAVILASPLAEYLCWALLNLPGFEPFNVSTGNNGTASAGDCGIATAGVYGISTAGDRGTAIAGRRGTATAGYRGTAIAGDNGTAAAGADGTLLIKYWDGPRLRTAIAYVGENNIEPGIPYRLDDNHKFVRGDK